MAQGFSGGVVQNTGKVLQQVRNSLSSRISSATTIPWDGSIPQITEGVEVLTLEITPSLSTSVLVIEGTITLGAGGLDNLTIALFVDSTSNAIAASSSVATNSVYVYTIPIKYYVSSGSTSARTYKIRAGASGNTVYINGTSSLNPLYGNITKTTLTVTEYEA